MVTVPDTKRQEMRATVVMLAWVLGAPFALALALDRRAKKEVPDVEPTPVTRLLALTGALLVIGFVLSLRAPAPGIASGHTARVPADELWRLNPE